MVNPVEVQGAGIWHALPVLLAFVGQLRANSNRYVDELRGEYRARLDV